MSIVTLRHSVIVIVIYYNINAINRITHHWSSMLSYIVSSVIGIVPRSIFQYCWLAVTAFIVSCHRGAIIHAITGIGRRCRLHYWRLRIVIGYIIINVANITSIIIVRIIPLALMSLLRHCYSHYWPLSIIVKALRTHIGCQPLIRYYHIGHLLTPLLSLHVYCYCRHWPLIIGCHCYRRLVIHIGQYYWSSCHWFNSITHWLVIATLLQHYISFIRHYCSYGLNNSHYAHRLNINTTIRLLLLPVSLVIGIVIGHC